MKKNCSRKRKLPNKSSTTSSVDDGSIQETEKMKLSKRRKNFSKKRKMPRKTHFKDQEGFLQDEGEGMSSKKKRKVNKKESKLVQKEEAIEKKINTISQKKQSFDEQIWTSYNVVTRSSAKKQLVVEANKPEQHVNTANKPIKTNVAPQAKVEFTENIYEIVSAPDMVSALKKNNGSIIKLQKTECNCIDYEYRDSFKYGWRREVVSCDRNSTNVTTDCYYNPRDIQLKSRPKMQRNLINSLTTESYSSNNIICVDITDSEEVLDQYSVTVNKIIKIQKDKGNFEFPEISNKGDIHKFPEDVSPKTESYNVYDASSIDNGKIIVKVEVHNEPNSPRILGRNGDSEQKLELHNQECEANNKLDILEINFPCKISKLNKLMNNLGSVQEYQMHSEHLCDIYDDHAESCNTEKEIIITETQNKKINLSSLEAKLKENSKIVMNKIVEKNIDSKDSLLVSTSTFPIAVEKTENLNLLKGDTANIMWNRNKENESKEMTNKSSFKESSTSKVTVDPILNEISNSRTLQNIDKEFEERISIDTKLHSNIDVSSTNSFSNNNNDSLNISSVDEKLDNYNNVNQTIIQITDEKFNNCSTTYTSELTKIPLTETENVNSITSFSVQTCKNVTDATRNASHNVNYIELNEPQEVIDQTYRIKNELIQKVCSQSHTLSYESNVETGKSKTIEINRLITSTAENNIYYDKIKVETLQVNNNNCISTERVSDELLSDDVNVFTTITTANETSNLNMNISSSEICKTKSLETSYSREIKSLNIVDYINSLKDESLQATNTITSDALRSLSMENYLTSMDKETPSLCKTLNVKIEPNTAKENALLNIVCGREIKSSDLQNNVCSTRSSRNTNQEEIDFYSNKTLENAALHEESVTTFQENQPIDKYEESHTIGKYIPAEIDDNSSDLDDDSYKGENVFTESSQEVTTLANKALNNHSTTVSSDILTKNIDEYNIYSISNDTSDTKKKLLRNTDSLNMNFNYKESFESYRNDCTKKIESTSNALSNEKYTSNVCVVIENQQKNILKGSNNLNTVNIINLLPININFDSKSEITNFKDQMSEEQNISESTKTEESDAHNISGQNLLSTINEPLNLPILIDNVTNYYGSEATIPMTNSVTSIQNNITNSNMQKHFLLFRVENTCKEVAQENYNEGNLIDYNIPLLNTSNTNSLQFTNEQHEMNSSKNLNIINSVKIQENYNSQKFENNLTESLNDPDSTQGITDVSCGSVNSPTDDILCDEQSSSTGQGNFSISDESNEKITFHSNDLVHQENSSSYCNISLITKKSGVANINIDTGPAIIELQSNENETSTCLNTVTASNLIQNAVWVTENSSNENKKINNTSSVPFNSQYLLKSKTSEIQELKKILESTIDEDDFYEETYRNLVQTNINDSDPENIFQIKKYLKHDLHNDSHKSILSESDGSVLETTEYDVNSSDSTPIKQSTPLEQTYSLNKRPLISNYPHSMVSFCSGYSLLKHIFKYLSFRDLLVARQVCRVWKEIVDQPLLWKKVQIKNNKMIEVLENTLQKHETEHILVIDEDCDNWETFINTVANINSLRVLELCSCPAYVLEKVTENCPQLEIISAQSIKSNSINIEFVKNLNNIQKLELRAETKISLLGNLACLLEFSKLMYLSLRSVKDLGKKKIAVIQYLKSLQTLELGECSEFSNTFGSVTLIELINLKRLRLEKVENSSCIIDILTNVSKLNNLTDLELVNIDVTNGFGRCLPKCHNIKKLMVIPIYERHLALSNNIILKTIPKLSNTLIHFVWGITEELLQFSKAIYEYPDDDSIPVLKPIPYLTFLEKSNSRGNSRNKNKLVSSTSELDMLSLSNLQKFYSIFLPTTQVDIIRVKVSETWNLTM